MFSIRLQKFNFLLLIRKIIKLNAGGRYTQQTQLYVNTACALHVAMTTHSGSGYKSGHAFNSSVDHTFAKPLEGVKQHEASDPGTIN